MAPRTLRDQKQGAEVGQADGLGGLAMRSMGAVAISVVVPAHGTGEGLMDQLGSLATQDFEGHWEIIIADNGLDTRVRGVVDTWVGRQPNARVLDATARPGAAHARNVATEDAAGAVVLYCDSDDLVAPWWVSSMAHASEQYDFVAGVDERLSLSPDGTSPAWRFEPSVPPYPATTESHAFLPWARGGNFGVRRAALEEVGGWDETWLRGQDVELSWRLQLRGYELYRVPGARVRYRRPDGLIADMRHQFEFGVRAPRLYRAFGQRPPWRTVLLRELKRVVWLATRSPYVVVWPARRRRWLLVAAGTVGRWVGSSRRFGRAAESRSIRRA
jgi:GT2 family glycosyltransferase